MIVRNKFNSKSYDIAKVANALRGKGIEETTDYKTAKDDLIDMTMSCDAGECVRALVNEARRVIMLATGEINPKARAEFLAAYDLAVSVNRRAFA